MKLTKLLADLQVLSDAHPNVDVDFKWIEYIGNGTTTRSVAYLDAKIVDDHAVIRMTDPDPVEMEKVLECDRALAEAEKKWRR